MNLRLSCRGIAKVGLGSFLCWHIPRPLFSAKLFGLMLSITLRVSCNDTTFGESLGVVGEGDHFGNWTKPLSLSGESFPQWCISFSVPRAQCDYKYVVLVDSLITRWEELPDGANRTLDFDSLPEDASDVIVDDGTFGVSRPEGGITCNADAHVEAGGKKQPSGVARGDGGAPGAASANSSQNESTPLLERVEPISEANAEQELWELPEVEDYMNRELSVTSAELATLATRLRELRKLKGCDSMNIGTKKDIVDADTSRTVESIIGQGHVSQGDDYCSTAEALALARELIEDATLSLEDVSLGLRKRVVSDAERKGASNRRTVCLLVAGVAAAGLCAVLLVDPLLVPSPPIWS